ncbi:MAG TPA: nickel transporter permease [Actinomycetota bacterium]|nr:nickel transporter permease [Actinomycetota bacterium]
MSVDVSEGRSFQIDPAAPEPRSIVLPARGVLLRRLVADPTALAGLVIVTLAVLVALLAPWIAPHDPARQNVMNRYAPPSAEHWLGTDNLGRDEFSRMVLGARTSVLTTLAIGAGVLTIGIVVGTLSGYVGGILDGLIMRIVDLLLAFPPLLLALVVTGVLGPGLLNLAIAMIGVYWLSYARLVRGLVLAMRERDFVEGARALGLSGRRIATRHILPNVVGPILAVATLRTGQLLLILAALSFLGLGVRPPTPEWGAMLSEGQRYLASAPQLMIYPGIAIAVVALGFNLLGDGLRDVLDPTLR